MCNRPLGSLGCGPPAPSASILLLPSPPPPSPRNPPPLRAPGLPSPPHLPWRCRSRRAGHALIQVAGREEPGPGLGIEQWPPGGRGGGQEPICRLQGRRAPPGARHSRPRGTGSGAAPGGLGRFRGPPLPPPPPPRPPVLSPLPLAASLTGRTWRTAVGGASPPDPGPPGAAAAGGAGA